MGRQKTHTRDVSTTGEDGHVCASLTVYGLGDRLGKFNLVDGDCLDATGDGWGRAGGGGIGARLECTARALGSTIQVSGK